MRFRLLVAVAVAGAMLLAGCEVPSFGFPDPVSEQAERIDSLWKGTIVVALAVGALVWGLILWSVVRYRRRSDEVPSQREYHIPLEIVYTAVPILLVIGLFFFTVDAERDVTATVADPDLTVDVIGYQWQWQFRYPGEAITVSGESAGEPPELVLPVGDTVRLNLITRDVNHSFWVPRFLAKRDLIPGVDNQIDIDVTEPGTYIGRCAEFCGLDHWRMNFEVRAVPRAEYEAWVADQQAGPIG